MPITYIIIGITVVISFITFSRSDIQARFMMNPYQIQRRGQYYRFITSGFIHGDHMHLLMNMLSLFFFGPVVETKFAFLFGDKGSLYFIALYLIAICVSDWPTYFKQRSNPGYNSLGASGGVAAIIFASIIFKPLAKIYLYFAIGIPGFILGAGYLIYSYFQGRKANDNINHDAHLFGAIFGLVFCIVVYPSSIPEFFQQVAQWEFFR